MQNQNLSFLFLSIDGYDKIEYFFNSSFVNQLVQHISIDIRSIFDEKINLYYFDRGEFIISIQSDNTIYNDNQKLEKKIYELLQLVNKPIVNEKIELSIGLSIGVLFSYKVDNYESIIYKSRLCAKFAFFSGGNRFIFYNDTIQSKMKKLIASNITEILHVTEHKTEDKVQTTKNTPYWKSSRVFFLNPDNLISTRLAKDILSLEYAIYIINDHEKLKNILKGLEHSVVYINIDEKLSDDEWSNYITALREDPEINDVRFGILTKNAWKSRIENFLINLQVEAGVLQLSTNNTENKHKLLVSLEALQLKERRKFLRVNTTGNPNVSFSIKIGDTIYYGKTLDISCNYMLAIFDNESLRFPVNYYFQRLNIQLNNQNIIVDGFLENIRTLSSTKHFYLIKFDEKDVKIEKNKIYEFIFDEYQKEIKNF